ncbi:intradiol ring-cleavage dioxygenase [Paraburkholderia sp. J8-2]|uniref:intradiol ring-cleavage dioxygenase n=1 Tax=Paraburkholderia sp. J8-2 TaxID=2805440 RepID=UPI002AB6FD6A|nr:intradiol ring-cleavage dioxygenase [Paraburkholderia sp. J8-2]
MHQAATTSVSQTSSPYFEEEHSADVVNARMGQDISPRLKQVMSVLVKHIHEAVKEIEPTHEEWFSAIRFLTETGQMCNEWRQEYILLSDILGVSMLVDAINHRRPSGATPNTILGPFYVADAPAYENGANICLDGKGEPLVVSGKVTDIAGNPIPEAKLEVWQTNDDGFYDVQQKGIQPDSNLRGVFTSDDEGRYWFKSVKPRHYPIPADGLVGKLLGAMGRHPNRAAHLHFIVTAPGYEPVITHIFTPDCPYLPEDAVFGVKRELIADFKKVDDLEVARQVGCAAPFWSVAWDFTLAPSVSAMRVIATKHSDLT